MKYKSIFLHNFRLFFLSFVFCVVFASPAQALVINEIYSSPTTGNTEWIELYNDSDIDVNLSDYTLVDLANNKITIPPVILAPKSFFTLSSSSILNNAGDTITLSSSNFSQTQSYPALSSSQSFATCPDGSANFIVTSQITKDASNNTLCDSSTPSIPPEPTNSPIPSSTTFPTPSPSSETLVEIINSPTPSKIPTPTPSKTPTLTPTPLYLLGSKNLIISEVYPAPEDGDLEWIEIYNPESKDVLISAWKIDDTLDGGSTPLSIDIYLPAKEYTIYELPKTMLNNTGDSLNLIDASGVLIASMKYTTATLGRSFSSTPLSQSASYCQTNPSPEKTNLPCENSSQNSSITPTQIPSNTNTPFTSALTNTSNSDESINTNQIITPLRESNFDANTLQSKRFDLKNLQSIGTKSDPEVTKGRVLGATSDGQDQLDQSSKKSNKISLTILLIAISSILSIMTLYFYQYENIKKYAQKILIHPFG